MVWQRAGTVSVQAGSTTVTGTNVDFAAGSRNGDSFIGPDGLTYEVINVASDTVISILPAYKGPTVSGAAYAIMPVQGYDKMLSDAFNNLNNQFGPKLAALGTTGNYDVLPVEKGGTGGKTLPEARTSLGLVPVVSNVDIAAGRLLMPGSGGVLGPPVAITNANGVTFLGGTRGIFTGSDDQAAAANFPSLGGGAAQRRWYIQTDLLDGGSSVQTAIETFGVSTTPGRKFTRTLQGGWRAWVEDVTLGNALLDPASGGLMYQTVVSGWLIQKFANGTMIMTGSPGNSPTVAVGATLAGSFTIPAGFIGLQCFVTGQPAGNTDCFGCIYSYPGTNTTIQYGVRNGATGAQVFLLRALITGQWK